jgi:hypothetical protein
MHTFQQFNALRGWLDYRVLEQRCLLMINYIHEFEPNIENKEEICQRYLDMAKEADRNVMEQRQLFMSGR